MAQSKNTPSASAPLFIARSQSRALKGLREAPQQTINALQPPPSSLSNRASSAASPRPRAALPASRKRMAREHFAQRTHAKADKRIRRGIAELRAHAYAFGNISLREWRGEIPRLRLRSARDKRRHLFGRNGLSARVSERDFLQLSIEGVPCLRPQARPKSFAAESVMAMPCDVAMARTWDGNSYALRGAQSMTALGPAAATAPIEARVFRRLIRKQRQHREIGWRCEIRDKRFRIGFLQIVGISHDNEAFVDAEGMVLHAATISPPNASLPSATYRS